MFDPRYLIGYNLFTFGYSKFFTLCSRKNLDVGSISIFSPIPNIGWIQLEKTMFCENLVIDSTHIILQMELRWLLNRILI